MGQRGDEENLLSLIYFLIVLSILVLVHEFGHFFFARRVGVRVEAFSFGFGPKLFSIKKGETEYLICAIPLGGYVKMAGDEPGTLTNQKWEFLSRSIWDRFQIIFAGPLLNYILAFLIFWIVFMFGSPMMTTKVGNLLKDYPAARDGILVGDRIITVDGKSVKFWEDMTTIIHKHTEGPIRLSIERDGLRIEKDVTPTVRKVKDIFGKETQVALIGIGPSTEMDKAKYGFFEAAGISFRKVVDLTVVTYKALWAILTGKLSLKESVTGPIGIFVLTGQVAKMGFIYILHLMGILSASLAIFNLLPLPVLDGGHIIFLAIEKLRGRPLSVKTQELIANIGIAFLILFTLFIIYNDVLRFGIVEKIIQIFKR